MKFRFVAYNARWQSHKNLFDYSKGYACILFKNEIQGKCKAIYWYTQMGEGRN